MNQSTGIAIIQGVTVDTVTGLSRGFYTAGGQLFLSGNYAINGVTTPTFPGTGVLLREQHNSWNPREIWGTFTSTTTGTWNAGDCVRYAAPTAGQPPGRICVTSGTPGTWKDMAAIAA
jgi:hypothetical protein